MRKLGKQALTWMLSLAMIFSVFSGLTVASAAAAPATVGVGSTTAAPGDTVAVPVAITSNPGVAGFGFTVGYDTANLTLVSTTVDASCIISSSALTVGTVHPERTTYASNTNFSGDGNLYILTFTVSSSAAPGDYPVSVALSSGADFCNKDEEDVAVTFTAGAISVKPSVQTVTAFDALDAGVATQNVPNGTDIGALTLPATLGATIGGAAATISGVTWASSPSYSAATAGSYTFTAVLPGGYAAGGVALPTITVNVASGVQTVTAFDALDAGVAAQNVPNGTDIGALTLPATLGATIGGAAATISGVTWASNPSYSAATAGSYTFTAVLPDGYAAGGVALPTITVNVASTVLSVTAFDALSGGVQLQSVPYGTAQSALVLPATLTATVGGLSQTISGVTWTPDAAYNAGPTVTARTMFTAVLPGGYALADGVALPVITVYVSPAVWDGTTIDVSWYNTSGTVFDISTPAQLEGLAAIVNGIYNTNITTVIGDSSCIHANVGTGSTSGGSGDVSFIQGSDDFDGKTVRITADLDMGGVYDTSAKTWSGPNYMPVGGQYCMSNSDAATHISSSWNGTFDGRGHTIKNIYCDRYSSLGYDYSQSVGLIGRMGIHDNDVAGGYNTTATPSVKNVAVSGYIYGRRSVGGIVGKNGKSIASVIENCVNYASVSDTDSKGVGGIAGAGWNCLTIKNCANLGKVFTSYSNAGGISGSCEAQVINCYNAGEITATNVNQAQSLGTNNGGAVWTNCYWLTGTSPCVSSPAVFGDTTGSTITEVTASDEMKTAAFLTALNGDGRGWVYIAGVNNGFPMPRTFAGPDTATVTGVTFTSDPAKLSYIEGQTFSTTGLKLVASYTDGTSEPVTNYTVSKTTALTAADTVITISGTYGGIAFSKSYDITVAGNALSGIYVYTTLTNRLYALGETLNTAGLSVKATFTNGTTSTLAAGDYTVTPSGALSVGDTAVTISYTYNGVTQTTTVSITVLSTAVPGSVDGVYQLASANDMLWFANQVNVGLNTAIKGLLVNDIDLSLVTWKPVGTSNKQFAGVLDGNGRTVTLAMAGGSSSSYNYYGIIGYAGAGANIHDLTAAGTVNGYMYVGGVVGYANTGAAIRNCVSKAAVSGYQYVGGIMGYENGATVSSCVNSGTVTGTTTNTSSYFGGIAGYATDGTIQNCVNKAAVTSGKNIVGGVAGYATTATTVLSNCGNEGTVTGANNVGGILGQTATNGITVSGCYNRAAVGGAYNVGGIVGTNKTSITNCYNTGAISASAGTATNGVGGIVGYHNQADAIISNTYSNGAITGTNGVIKAGALAGYSYSTLTLSNSYYLADTVSAAYNEKTSGAVTATSVASKSTAELWALASTLGSAYKTGSVSPILTWQADENTAVNVSFSVTPGTAAVTVTDSSSAAVSPTGSNVYQLIEGAAYSYAVSADNYVTATGSFTVQAGGQTIDVVLTRATANMTFNVTPSDALVSLISESSGAAVSPTSGTTYSVNVGDTYNYTISAANYATKTGAFFVNTSGDLGIDVALDRATDTVTFSVTPAAATVTVKDASDAAVSPSGSNTYLLNEGATYSYAVSADSYETRTGSFTVASGGQTITLALVHRDTVTFSVTPAAATVTVKDTSDATVSPSGSNTYLLNDGTTYKYTVSLSGYETKTAAFTVSAGGQTITVSLVKTDTVTFTVSPANGSVHVSYTNAYNGIAATPASGDTTTGTYVYQLYEGKTYFYQVSAAGYTGKVGSYTVTDGGGSVNVTLVAVNTGTITGGQTISTGGTYYLTTGATGVISIGTTDPVTIVGTGVAAAPAPADKFSALTLRCTVAGANLTIQDLYICNTTNLNLIDFTGTGNNLKIAGTNMLEQMSYAAASMIHVGADTAVTIGGTGTLYMYKYCTGAGIGGNAGEANGAITLAGGTILIKGSKTGALIGNDLCGAAGIIGNISITGGDITLINKAQGAAIGGSRLSYGGNVYLKGGTLTIISDFAAAREAEGDRPNRRLPGPVHHLLDGCRQYGNLDIKRHGAVSTILGFVPVERALLPHVGVARQEHHEEDDDLREAGPLQVPERHRPGIEEGHLDVEEQEDHRDQVELDRVPFTRVGHRRHATLVRCELLGRRIAWPENARQHDGSRAKCRAEDHQQKDRQPALHVNGVSKATSRQAGAGHVCRSE